MNVDNVDVMSAPTRAQWNALDRLKRLAASPGRNAPWGSASGKWTKSTGKLNNRGRFCWQVKIAPPPKGCEVLDYLLPGMKKACWEIDTSTGEYWLWCTFTVLVHWKTLEYMLRQHGVTTVYTQGCRLRDVDEKWNSVSYDRL